MAEPLIASYCTTFLKAEMLHIYRQVTGLRRFRTFVATKERRNADRYPFDDMEILPEPRSNFLRRFWLKYVRRASPILYRGEFQVLNAVLRRREAALMHIYFGHTAVHLLPFIEIWDRPCVVSFHGADVMLRESQPEYAGLMRRMLEVVPLVLVRSQSLRERVIALGCEPSKIRMNRTGIPVDAFPYMKREVPADGAWHFVQACRLIPKKGLRVALRAFAEFRKRHPRARFTLAGAGPMEEELRGFVGELGIADGVAFSGFLSQEGLRALFGQAHVFVHPSEVTSDQNQEGIPNSMLEAMATGLPVLATLHGGIPEAVENGTSGLLVPERDDAGLAAAMERLTGDAGLWRSMGRAASDSVAASFSHAAQIARLEDCYAEALARFGDGPVTVG
jgi:colanic acid/amylovoran biosynthesis glycosyltransferase